MGILLMGLCVGVPGALAQGTFTVVITDATVNATGVATLSGVVTCSEAGTDITIFMFMTQPIGRAKTVTGFSADGIALGPCDPDEPSPFSVQVFPFGGEGTPGGRFG